MADATPKDAAPIPVPEEPESEQSLPPTEPLVPDELADFFGVGGTELTKPEQILADVQEARKDGFARRTEVNKAVADQENPTTKQGREMGTAFVKDLTGEIEPSRVSLILGETTAEHLQAAETADVDAVIEVLSRELRGLDGGSRDIFKNLGDAEATAAVGVQRRTDQQRVVALKSTLLGMSEEAFTVCKLPEST